MCFMDRNAQDNRCKFERAINGYHQTRIEIRLNIQGVFKEVRTRMLKLISIRFWSQCALYTTNAAVKEGLIIFVNAFDIGCE